MPVTNAQSIRPTQPTSAVKEPTGGTGGQVIECTGPNPEDCYVKTPIARPAPSAAPSTQFRQVPTKDPDKNYRKTEFRIDAKSVVGLSTGGGLSVFGVVALAMHLAPPVVGVLCLCAGVSTVIASAGLMDINRYGLYEIGKLFSPKPKDVA
jgi:hypothetical protein